MTTNQITDTTNPFMVVFMPSISNDGTRITFQSQANITPPGRNPDGSLETYLFDSSTNRTTQITNNNSSGYGVISPDGRKASLGSDFDITPPRNTDRNYEIFLFDISRSPYSVTQITETTTTVGNENSAPSLNSNASLITFMSTANDLSGGNADQNQEIFLFDSVTRRFTQITNTTTVFNVFPRISSDGSHIVFISEADLTGENPDGSQEKFLYDIGTRTFIQIPGTVPFLRGYALNFSIDADGSRIALDEHYNILLFDKNLMSTTFIASGVHPSINGDGAKIAFRSSSNLTGENSDYNGEIFLADCSDGTERTSECRVENLILPIPSSVPVCRCLQDSGAREFRCALLNPDFFLVFRTPIPVFVDEPFEMSWTLIPLTKIDGDLYVNTDFPTNFKLKDKKSSVMMFPSSIDVDKTSKAILLVLPPNKPGNYPLKSRVMITDKKGKRILDQTLEFEFSVFNGKH
jgi:Tol biopolymer transport system component